MTLERDRLLEALAAAEMPGLPPHLSARTLARASAHLEPKSSGPAPARPLAIPIPAFAVPALLASAAIVLAVDTCVRVARIFGAS